MTILLCLIALQQCGPTYTAQPHTFEGKVHVSSGSLPGRPICNILPKVSNVALIMLISKGWPQAAMADTCQSRASPCPCPNAVHVLQSRSRGFATAQTSCKKVPRIHSGLNLEANIELSQDLRCGHDQRDAAVVVVDRDRERHQEPH